MAQRQRIIGTGVKGYAPSSQSLSRQTTINKPMTERYYNPIHEAGYNSRGRAIGSDYVSQEPDRFVRQGQVTKKLIDNVKDKFVNFESFKLNVTQEWNKDTSLQNLINSMTQKDWQSLYNTSEVQSMIKNNTEIKARIYLAKKLNVSEQKAGVLLGKMTKERYRKFLNNVNSTDRAYDLLMAKQTQPKTQAQTYNIMTLHQTARSGKKYERSKPQRWTDEQVTFLKNYNGFRAKDIEPLYNRFFANKRTTNSISTKVLRLKKGK